MSYLASHHVSAWRRRWSIGGGSGISAAPLPASWTHVPFFVFFDLRLQHQLLLADLAPELCGRGRVDDVVHHRRLVEDAAATSADLAYDLRLPAFLARVDEDFPRPTVEDSIATTDESSQLALDHPRRARRRWTLQVNQRRPRR